MILLPNGLRGLKETQFGALNDWLALAPQATPFGTEIGVPKI
jgi:hypothetical protein